MNKKSHLSPDPAGLLLRAQARLKEQSTKTATVQPEVDAHRLVHELQVHRIELEMQNEEFQSARNELEASLEKYSDLYDFAPVGYVTLDREGAIHEANLTCASLLGSARPGLIRRRFGVFVSPADLPAFNTFLAQVFENTGRKFCEVALLKKDKSTFTALIEGVAAASGQECRVSVTDITGRKRAEEDRLILSKLESTGILAGGIAHDFNNLLTVMLLDLELAQEMAPSGTELVNLLGEAKKVAMLARGLTQQLITFSKGGAPVRKPTHLEGLLQGSARLALSGSNVLCEFSLADDLWWVEVDEGQIGQCIRNLILNAREAMPEGGTISVRAKNVVLAASENASLPPGEYVRINIADRGVGIARDLLPKIFDPYYSTKQRGDQKGMGLGLTICYTVIQKHGGSIAVESEAGVGTTLQIHLPAVRTVSSEEPAAAPKSQPRSGRILVMDDEDGERKLIGRFLGRIGLEVELVENGELAIAAYEQAKEQGRPFDVVLLDLTIRGGMGGQETIQALRKLDPTVRAIVMSGYSDDPVVLEPERYGFAGALAKPFGKDRLQETVSRVMKIEPGHLAAP